MDPRPLPALHQDRQHHARESRAGAEVGPGPGLRRQGQELSAVESVAAPERVHGRWSHEVHLLVPLSDQRAEGFEVSDLGGARACRGGEAGCIADAQS